MNKKKWSLLMVTIIGIFIISFVFDLYYNSAKIGNMKTIERGRVVEILPDTETEYIKIEILTGTYKKKYCIIENVYFNSDYFTRSYRTGDKVLITIDTSEGIEPFIELSGFARDQYELYLVLIFFLLLLLIGRKQGLKSAVSLMITITIIIKLMLPLILKGYSPIFSAIISCLIITILSLFIITGITSKSVATILGTSIGVITAGILAYVIGNLSHFSGLSSDEATSLMLIDQELAFNFTGILFAGIIIGTLGAVMDVSMSIASSMNEIKENNPEISRMDLIKSGMNIGKDIMGTMTNTLILAYTGASIPLMLFFAAKNTPLVIILNTELISTEITRALSGSIGLILSIPATSVIAGLLLKRKKEKKITTSYFKSFST